MLCFVNYKPCTNLVSKECFLSDPKDVHVVPHGDDWVARRPNTDRVSEVFDTQQQAIDYAREIAQRDHSELLVHNRQGQIRHRDSFGSDPYPPKDKK